jgi:glycosyltransferase involved in cell wall biosynthesis
VPAGEAQTFERASASTEQPLVSIIVPSHNYGAFLAESIESALSQTYSRVEVIVIDDGSEDNSSEVAGRFSDRIRLITQENQGLVAVLNRGLREANGTYVTVLSADDMFQPQYVERLMQALADHPTAAYAYSAMEYFGARTGILRAEPYSTALLLAGNTINACGLMLRADALAVGGFNAQLEVTAFEEWDFWLSMLEHGRRGVAVDEPLLRYRQHSGPSRNPAKTAEKREGARLMQRLHPSLYRRRPRPVRFVLLKAATAAYLVHARSVLRLLDRLWGL